MTDPTVRLMHYDPRWKQEFEQTRSSILQSCGGWVTCVEHIGSTAISGLIARPTIDILAAVAPTSSTNEREHALTEAANLIEGLNFRRHPVAAWAIDSILLDKPRHGAATHRIYLTATQSPAWRQALAIRDHLRRDPELAIRFEETKVARWRSSEGDPEKYEKDKSVFFTHLLDQLGGGKK
ncbi:MAG: GrpB family protein [Pirellulaceae bacterium]|nr:GrpB family protein [Pirellulaceae bacterium]